MPPASGVFLPQKGSRTKNMDNTTIVQKISTNCDNLPAELRKAKETKHYTNQQVADETGLSISTVNKMLAGELKNPGIFSVAPVCICLGLSMDNLLGAQQPGDDTANVERLEMQLEHSEEMRGEKEEAIKRLLDRSRILEHGIATRDTQISRKDAEIKSIRKSYRPLIYGLCCLSILLTVLWGVYVILDFKRPDVGLIRTGNVSPLVLLGIVCVFALLVTLLYIIVIRLYRKVK